MDLNALCALYDYGYWANRKLFDVLSQLTAEQFVQPIAGSYGSIRNTLVHSMSAEWGWLDRCGGTPRGPRLNPDDYPTIQSLAEMWRTVEGYVRDFLSNLKPEDLSREVIFAIGESATHSLQIGSLLHHSAIHGIHHRAQVALLLRVLGYTPGNLDLLVYCLEQSSATV
jgi:uncharacterized damage-inducible protein DinB